LIEVILDTDILSEVLKGRNATVQSHQGAYTAVYKQLRFTSFSAFEIVSGLRQRDAKAQLSRAEELFSQNAELVPESADFRLAADIVGDLLKGGHSGGIVDPFIAACAIRRGLGVATGNTRHFSYMVEAGYRLSLQDWRQA